MLTPCDDKDLLLNLRKNDSAKNTAMNFQENISLKSYNSFGIYARAKYFTSFSSAVDLQESLEARNNLGIGSKDPMILGGGSNILFTKDFDGIILKNDIAGIELVKEEDGYVYVKAGAGVNWHAFVLYCLDNNFAGVENLSLIPGNVGASPMQNIGAYGVEIKDVFHSLEAFHLQEKKIVSFSLNDCAFGYRESVFKGKYRNQFAIMNVTYRLSRTPTFNISYGAIQQELEVMGVRELSIQAIAGAVINIRRSKLPDPAVIGNAGSFFKNPEVENTVFEKLKENFPSIVGYDLANEKTKLAAGWMIEQCGWKGYRQGDAGCHSRQALVLVNYGNASGKEIYALSEEIIASVQQKFGVTLQREVNII
jgi:UDP-N-acetylmuramate dehydrogenase